MLMAKIKHAIGYLLGTLYGFSIATLVFVKGPITEGVETSWKIIPVLVVVIFSIGMFMATMFTLLEHWDE